MNKVYIYVKEKVFTELQKQLPAMFPVEMHQKVERKSIWKLWMEALPLISINAFRSN